MQHFEVLPKQKGLVRLQHNPCKLLDFAELRLDRDEIYAGSTGDREAMFVVLGGRVTVEAGRERFDRIGGRANPFQGRPWAVYLPPGTGYSVAASAGGSAEVAVCSAVADRVEGAVPFLITPAEVQTGVWGADNFARRYHEILVNTDRKVQRLIVGETYTPSGNWSTYPPHKHEEDRLPESAFMEEIYYFRVAPPEGFGLTMLYTDARDIDEMHRVVDRSVLKIARGYHTVVSAPGYTTYYLWFLAGHHRTQAPVLDPSVGWVQKAVGMLRREEGL
ncbi:MAG: 5-deoxy-glucuronate isomerase [Bacillota bacterium]